MELNKLVYFVTVAEKQNITRAAEELHITQPPLSRAMGRTAVSIGATTFAFFTRNPRGGSAKALNLDDVCELRRILSENHFGKLVAHAPYTMNLCSANPDTMVTWRVWGHTHDSSRAVLSIARSVSRSSSPRRWTHNVQSLRSRRHRRIRPRERSW